MIRRVIQRAARILLGLTLITLLVVGAYGVWYFNRPRPQDTQQTLFDGIEYIRDVRESPRPLVIHVLKINLDTPGLEFLVTPHTPTNGHVQAARTTSAFLDEFDLQIAMNADFFDPWWNIAPWDYYPHAGDPVNIQGLAASRGDVYTQGYGTHYTTLYLSRENRASFAPPESPSDIYNAVSGNLLLIRDGVILPQEGVDSYLIALHPRAALALDADQDTLIAVLVDGRQPNYSEGTSLDEFSEIILEYGGYTALNLDGGGSVTLVTEGEDGRPLLLNSPIHSRIPGLERPIANHLGIYAQR